jgi:hypothetical protein
MAQAVSAVAPARASPNPPATSAHKNGARLQAARRAATARYLAIASAIKAEAGVKGHYVRSGLSGVANLSNGWIAAPEGRTRKQLYVLAHECGHIALHAYGRYKGRPAYVTEFEAEMWAHDALRRHGVAVPRAMTASARLYIGRKIAQARKAGAHNICPVADAFARGMALPRRVGGAP